MDELLKLLRENSAIEPGRLAKLLEISEEEVVRRIKAYEADGTILGYNCMLNDEKLDVRQVSAVIEVRTTPERDGGFDRLAKRISKYDEVRSCYLMSGGYDLLVVVEGDDLRSVANFVSEKLATVKGVVSTATHFMLKTYKSRGILVHADEPNERLAVSP